LSNSLPLDGFGIVGHGRHISDLPADTVADADRDAGYISDEGEL
jgi:hypothetical protein